MSYCTNAADDGRVFEFFGVHLIRDSLKNPGMPEDEKDALLRTERKFVADYYNWLFDREQERKTHGLDVLTRGDTGSAQGAQVLPVPTPDTPG